MNNGLSRFTFYTQQIKVLLSKAREENDPALWLLNNNARTPFFMLEGLAKVYTNLHNPKKFDKLREHFKLIEDGLGQIDYYYSLCAAFAADKLIPTDCRQYIVTRLDQSVAQMNDELKNKDWLSNGNNRILKITEKLKEADWLNPIKEVGAISGFYKSSIVNITQFVTETNYHFDNVEKDVHELRRKLRWLSIYPQAFQGAIQYATDIKTAAHLKKYLTREIINSPYNKLPPAGNNTSFFLLQKNYFLALSWMIAQLGNLKDEGLLLTGLCEAIKHNTACMDDEILVKAETLLGRKQRRMQSILDDSEAITRTFFKENNLQHLIS